MQPKYTSLGCCSLHPIVLTLKESGFLNPSHSRGGGVAETDWRNIKCVVLVDSYDPAESIGTKKKYKHTLYDSTVIS